MRPPRKIRLRDHAPPVEPPAVSTCETCVFWFGVSTKSYRICQNPASAQYTLAVYRTYKECREHKV